MAEERIKWKDTLPPRRGLIYDSRGQLLAGNVTAHDVFVDISHHEEDKDKHAIADRLAPLLGQDPQALFTRLKEAGEGQVYIKVASRVDDATAEKINAMVKENSKLFAYTL